MEPGVQTPGRRSATQRSCRDSGWLLVQIMLATSASRRVRLRLPDPARGRRQGAGRPVGHRPRLHRSPPPGPRRHIPARGLDRPRPTSGLLAGEGTCRSPAPPDPGNAAPVIGYTDVCNVDFVRHGGDARARGPARHQAVQRSAVEGDRRAREAVDRDLVAHDVRLTQGGEPTFVSIGRHGRRRVELHRAVARRSARLASNCCSACARFAPGGFPHYGQGKWYPGEPLPRWALGVFWRADGRAVVDASDLVADTTAPGTTTRQARARSAATGAIARPAAIAADHGHEDVPKYLAARKAALPVNAGSAARRISTKPDERARLAKLLAGRRPRRDPCCRCVPRSTRGGTRRNWQSSRGRCGANTTLRVAGDSPLGLRLPLVRCPRCSRASRSRSSRRSVRAARDAARATMRRGQACDGPQRRARSSRPRCDRGRPATASSSCRRWSASRYVALLTGDRGHGACARLRVHGRGRRLHAAARSARHAWSRRPTPA